MLGSFQKKIQETKDIRLLEPQAKALSTMLKDERQEKSSMFSSFQQTIQIKGLCILAETKEVLATVQEIKGKKEKQLLAGLQEKLLYKTKGGILLEKKTKVLSLLQEAERIQPETLPCSLQETVQGQNFLETILEDKEKFQ